MELVYGSFIAVVVCCAVYLAAMFIINRKGKDSD